MHSLLTKREKEIFIIDKSQSTRQIADSLCISEKKNSEKSYF